MKKILNIDVFEKLNDGRLLARGSNPDFSMYSISEVEYFFIGEKFLKDDNGYLQKVQIIACYVMQVMWRDQIYDVEFASLKLDEIPPNVSIYEESK